MKGNYNTLKSDIVRKIIAENGWFEKGDEYNYHMMLKACENKIFTNEMIAAIIWSNSKEEYSNIIRALRTADFSNSKK